MRVLIYPHDLGMGGSQLNAIELAARTRDLGWEPVVFGRPGVLVDRIRELDLEFIESPDPGRRPSTGIARHLRELVRHRKIDILHGYEWPPSLECAAAAFGLPTTRSVSTIMSMAVAPFIPRTTPLVVGTEQIAAAERAAGRWPVFVIEPPVDLDHNISPPAKEIDDFRRRWGLRPNSIVVTCVSRLANELKSEGILQAIAAVDELSAEVDIQLLIVGDGPARFEIQAEADRVTRHTQAGRIILTGELLDPRTAYAAADIVMGMGGSALRAMAFSKPLVVQGERGFFKLLTRHSWEQFAWQGWYGLGSDSASGKATLQEILRNLVRDESARDRSGALGRSLVEQRFSLAMAAEKQVAIYSSCLETRPSGVRSVLSAGRSAGSFAKYYLRRKINRARHLGAADDFNAHPVASSGTNPGRLPQREAASAVIYLSGAPWHAVSGTDVSLVKELGLVRPVIWVDPPISITSRILRRIEVPRYSQIATGVTRVHATVPPGVTRPGVRAIAQWVVLSHTRRYLRTHRCDVGAIVTSSPEAILPRWRGFDAPRMYFATDDFVAGAELLGLARGHVEKALDANLRSADAVLAVSPTLVRRMERRGAPTVLFPNGTDLDRYRRIEHTSVAAEITLPSPMAGLFGQINERLDLHLLEAVVESGVSLLLLGPRYDRDPDFRRRLTRLIACRNVQWVDRRPSRDLPNFMAAITVGLTPYGMTSFNLASFPLKTLDYLAAGREVVSSPLPANELLDPRVVHAASSPETFAATVAQLLLEPRSPARSDLCVRVATRFSWTARAREFDFIIRHAGVADLSAASSRGCSHREAKS